MKIKFFTPLTFIFLIAFILRFVAAYHDHFLHDWDERFHALVARNMMDNPFTPMLHKHIFDQYDINSWCCNHIWLHKQPLFLWQMALSMKIFGVSLLAMRLPSIMMASLMVLLIHRLVMMITKNKQVAILAALFLCFNNYQIHLVSGEIGMDHNDIALQFYILCSFWALGEFYQSKQKHWITLIGVFAGCAVLNKWLIGLSVFLGWGTILLFDFLKTKNIKITFPFLISLFVCLLVFLPWQFYIFYRWPDIASYEMQYNSRHITEVIENHGGGGIFT